MKSLKNTWFIYKYSLHTILNTGVSDVCQLFSRMWHKQLDIYCTLSRPQFLWLHNRDNAMATNKDFLHYISIVPIWTDCHDNPKPPKGNMLGYSCCCYSNITLRRHLVTWNDTMTQHYLHWNCPYYEMKTNAISSYKVLQRSATFCTPFSICKLSKRFLELEHMQHHISRDSLTCLICNELLKHLIHSFYLFCFHV